MIKLIDKMKGVPPEEWQGAYDWDFKPMPEEIEYVNMEDEEEDESNL